MKTRILAICLVILFLVATLEAGLREDLATISKTAGLQSEPEKTLRSLEKPAGFGFIDQIKFPFYGLLFLYQNFISTQQGEVCMFEPSCSEFTKQALKKYGFKGVIMGADRIQRCNGLGAIYYDEPGSNQQLIHDPIELYELKIKKSSRAKP